MDQRIVQLGPNAPCKEICLMWGSDSDGLCGVHMRMYFGDAPRENWLRMPDLNDCRQYIATVKAEALEPIAHALMDELLDLRLAVQMAEALVPAGERMRQLISTRPWEAAELHAKETVGMRTDANNDEWEAATSNYIAGYRQAEYDHGIEEEA